MRVLLTGAYGLIGSAILARLHRDGHELVAAGRSIDDARRRFPYATWIVADFARLTTVDAWRPLLASVAVQKFAIPRGQVGSELLNQSHTSNLLGTSVPGNPKFADERAAKSSELRIRDTNVDAVVNCVGVLQDGGRDDVHAVQVEGTCALFDACVQAGIRRVVHVSAIGALADGPTAFSRTKAQADAHLAGLDLDWTILRPGLVLAPAAYGGTAMLRGLAGLPWLTPAIASQVQVVSVDDVADTVAFCLGVNAPARMIWELTHPETHDLGDVVAALRQWHGFPPRPRLRIPAAGQGIVAMFAEVAGWLGWRSPARATALAQLSIGVVGDPSGWMRASGIKPKRLDAILAERPASVQDRWFARLYWLKPVAILGLAAFWIATGVIALGPGRAAAMGYLTEAGFGPAMARLSLDLGSLFDIAMGLALCVRRFTRRVLQIMLVVTPIYLLVGTVTAPELWFDPLGPYTKIIPMLLATALTLAIVDER